MSSILDTGSPATAPAILPLREPDSTAQYSLTDPTKLVDIWLPDAAGGGGEGGGPYPVVVFFHGGGLMEGLGDKSQTRAPERRWVIEYMTSRKVAFVAPSYSLMPTHSASDMIQDVRDLFVYLSSPSNSRIFLPSQIGCMGSSAGCYLSQLAALHSLPRPRVLGLNWGMGSTFFIDYWVRRHDPEDLSPILKRVPGNGLSKLLIEGSYLDALTATPGLSESLRLLSTPSDRASFLPESLVPFFPELQLSPSFPPTALVHGTGDRLVLPSESITMAERLKALGVEVQLELVEGGDHGLGGGGIESDEMVQAKRVRVAEFVVKHLLA